MGFKLKFKNVQTNTDGPSPFKINEALVAGAGTAAKGFTDLQGSFMAGVGGDSGTSSSGSSSSEAEKESKEKTCVEQGLEGQELEDCQAKEKENDNKKNNEEEEGGADYLSRKDWKDQDLKGDGEGQFASYSDYKASFDTPE